MLSTYTCRQCRARFTRVRTVLSPRNGQWQSRSAFQSLRDRTLRTETEDEDSAGSKSGWDNTAAEDQLATEDAQKRGEQPLVFGAQNGRYSRVLRSSRFKGKEDTRKSAGTRHDTVRDSRGGGVTTVDESVSPACALAAALDGRRFSEAWLIFEKHYTSATCKALTEPSADDLPHLERASVFWQLLRSVNNIFYATIGQSRVTPTMALFRFEQLGINRTGFWANSTIAGLTHQAILVTNTTPSQPRRDLPALLSELLSVWQLFFQCHGRDIAPLDFVSDTWNLPPINAMPELYDSKDFNTRLQTYHPRMIRNPTLGFCAVYIYTVAEALEAVESLRDKAEPFVRFVERLLAGSHINTVFVHAHNSRAFDGLPQEIQEEVTKEFHAAPLKALTNLTLKGASISAKPSDAGTEPMSIAGTIKEQPAEQIDIQRSNKASDTLGTDMDTLVKEDHKAKLDDFYLTRIARAVKSRTSAEILDVLWKEAVHTYVDVKKALIPHRVYNAFLSGYMTLFHPQRSVEVWNHMIDCGVQPVLQSWNALLEGCVATRDIVALNETWTRMLAAGAEPTNYTWTTRIHGLFSMRQIKVGLAALDEMGERWRSAEDMAQRANTRQSSRHVDKRLSSSARMVNKCSKPSIEVINGAVSAIIQFPGHKMSHNQRVEITQKVLRWALQFDVQPDIITYNNLIRLYLSGGDYATIFKILRQMEKDGMEADVATHAMLVTAAFDTRMFDNVPMSEQSDRVLALFDKMENGGVRLNEYVYGTAIDRLMKDYSNHTAVRTVIDRMLSRGLALNAHIYTSLITAYFQQDPPPMAAIDSLIHEIFTNHRIPADRTLFDRTLEGYAAHGEIGRMMSMLTRLSKYGRLPGWEALTRVIRALVEHGDLERARTVVSDVQRGEGAVRSGVRGSRQKQRQFFESVRALGIGPAYRPMQGSQPDDGVYDMSVSNEQDCSHGIDRILPTAESTTASQSSHLSID